MLRPSLATTQYARAQKAGVEVDALLVEPSGACGPRLTELLVEAAEARSNKLTSSEYDETIREIYT